MNYQELLTHIEEINPVSYAKTRNFLDGDVTRLSMYITRGVVTLPQIREIVLRKYSKQESYKFIQELAWREYFQRVWQERGEDIFRDIRFEQKEVLHIGVPTSVAKGSTGVAVIDAGIETLYDTGYMHNHVRMSVASIICNLGRYQWLEPAQWMYFHLLDGDPASNMLSWQWIAGTSISKRYTTSQPLINYWSQTNQQGTLLDFERDDFFDQDVPQELKHVTKLELKTALPQSDEINFSTFNLPFLRNFQFHHECLISLLHSVKRISQVCRSSSEKSLSFLRRINTLMSGVLNTRQLHK